MREKHLHGSAPSLPDAAIDVSGRVEKVLLSAKVKIFEGDLSLTGGKLSIARAVKDLIDVALHPIVALVKFDKQFLKKFRFVQVLPVKKICKACNKCKPWNVIPDFT